MQITEESFARILGSFGFNSYWLQIFSIEMKSKKTVLRYYIKLIKHKSKTTSLIKFNTNNWENH